MGTRVRQLLATLYVALSLTLFALGGANPTGGFGLITLSYSRPMIIVGPILNTVVVSCIVVGTLCEALGRRVNMGLLHLVRAHRFASSVVTLRSYKADGHPCAHLRSLT
jgi:hypothetical protein